MLERGLIFSFLLAVSLIFAPLAASPPVSKSVKSAVAPYLLPEDHVIRPLLEKIFTRSRVILNLETLEKAGFEQVMPRKFTSLIVTKHPQVPGYIFKIYLDAQRYHKNTPEHEYWIMRIQGAERVRNFIQSNGWEMSFKVPHKWIYELPKTPKPSSDYQTKYYILVEEDMNLLSSSDNKKAWGSDQVTHELLDQFYRILKKIGLADCAKTMHLFRLMVALLSLIPKHLA